MRRAVRRRRARCGRSGRGYALLIALVVVFLISVALALLAASLALRMRLVRDEVRATTLTALCDAALAEALSDLAVGRTAGIREHPFGDGTIGSEVEALGHEAYSITATAHFAGRARSAVASVVRDAAGTRVVCWRRLPG